MLNKGVLELEDWSRALNGAPAPSPGGHFLSSPLRQGWQPPCQLQGRTSFIGLTGACTFAGNLWEAAECSPVLKKWVLEKQTRPCLRRDEAEVRHGFGEVFFWLVE